MNIRFDSLKKEYVQKLALLDKECFRVAWSENLFEKETTNPNARYVLAFSDGELVGYGGFYSVVGEGDITNIAVLPSFRQKGIASSILKRMLEIAIKEKLEFLTLEVRESNIGAINLYKKFGFEFVGSRKGYYSDNGETALLMTKYL